MLQRTINSPETTVHGLGVGLKVGDIELCEDGAGGHFAAVRMTYEMLRPEEDAMDMVDVMTLRVRVVPVTAEMTMGQICDAALGLGERLVWSAGGMHDLDTTKNHWPYR